MVVGIRSIVGASRFSGNNDNPNYDLGTHLWEKQKVRNPFRKLRYVKWWFQRANHKVPPCDCWDYKHTLADNIAQGMEFLLHEGVTDWENPLHKQEKAELEFVLDWAREFPYYDSAIFARDENEKKELQAKFGSGGYIVCTKQEFEAWQKRTEKAFKYLAKNIHGLWD